MDPSTSGPERYEPHGPKLGFGHLESQEPPEKGLYQPPNEEQIKLADTLPNLIETFPKLDIKVDDYQAWCDLNWKKPQGTAESSDRLKQKLQEEFEELKKEFALSPDHRSTEDIIGELGDVVWCANGVASNLSASVKHGLMLRFDAFGRGTRNFSDHSVPDWVRHMQLHSYEDSMDLSVVDRAVELGYKPQLATRMLFDGDSDPAEIEIHDALENLDFLVKDLLILLDINYGQDVYQTGSVYRRDEVEQIVAQVYLDIAFLAKFSSDSSFQQVIKKNILKLSGRVDTNTIDKTDGPRLTE